MLTFKRKGMLHQLLLHTNTHIDEFLDTRNEKCEETNIYSTFRKVPEIPIVIFLIITLELRIVQYGYMNLAKCNSIVII
jgi:hypothetical protein